MRRKILVLSMLLLALTSVVWMPAVAFAVTGNFDKFDYYVKALEYLLNGLVEYFKAVVELFKAAVAST